MNSDYGKAIWVSASALAGLFALTWGGSAALDRKYETKEAHGVVHETLQSGIDSMAHSSLKREIREIRDALFSTNDAERKRQLELDLKDAIDRLCMKFPQDRECR